MAQPASSNHREDELSRFCDRLDRIGNAMDVCDILRSTAADAGFRHFTMLKFALDTNDATARRIVFTSLPQSVIRDLEQNGATGGGPSVSSARRSLRPFTWDRVSPFVQQAENDNHSGQAILARAGITMGVSLPVSSWRAVRGLVLFGGERPLPDFQEVARLSLVSNGLFDRLVEIEAEKPGADDFRLTIRERQCLTWTSAGKTSAEIAGILGLSEHTVNQYITASGQKLGAVNRTQTVAKAIRLRLID